MIVSAFIIGFLGSIHCVGMCGPIACLVRGHGNSSLLINRLLYNAGRLVTYAVLGSFVGLLGRLFYLGGLQPIISIVAGVLIIVFLLFQSLQRKFVPMISKPVGILKRKFSNLLRQSNRSSAFLVGLFNGLLPCGLVYSGLAIALLQSSILDSTLSMVVFGLGTVPALVAFTYASNVVYKVIPVSIRKIQITLLITVAVLMIWRGISFESFNGTSFSNSITSCFSVK